MKVGQKGAKVTVVAAVFQLERGARVPVARADPWRSCSVGPARLPDHVLHPTARNSWKSMERGINRSSAWCSSCAAGLRLDGSRASPVMAGTRQANEGRGSGDDGDYKLIEWLVEGSWTSAQTPQVVGRAASNCRGWPSALWPGRKGDSDSSTGLMGGRGEGEEQEGCFVTWHLSSHIHVHVS